MSLYCCKAAILPESMRPSPLLDAPFEPFCFDLRWLMVVFGKEVGPAVCVVSQKLRGVAAAAITRHATEP